MNYKVHYNPNHKNTVTVANKAYYQSNYHYIKFYNLKIKMIKIGSSFKSLTTIGIHDPTNIISYPFYLSSPIPKNFHYLKSLSILFSLFFP